MKNFVPLFLSALLIIAASCGRKAEKEIVDLNQPWKFQTGDDPAWASPALDDSKWDTVLPTKIWEEQNYKGYNGFGWYRVKVIIPSTIKDNCFIRDSVQFLLGKIDDCDQVFLNGELIGQNGVTIYSKMEPNPEFFNEQGKWNLSRKYVLATGDSRILWDKENVIAIRTYDQGGSGGMFGKPFEISMVDLADHIQFDFSASAFIFEGDTQMTRKFEIRNISGSEEFKGKLDIHLATFDNKYPVLLSSMDIVLAKLDKKDLSVSFAKDPSKPATLIFTFTESTSRVRMTERLDVPYILTPKSPKEPRINGARVFGVRPYASFFYKIAATGEPPLIYFVDSLPKGLSVNPESGIITGMLTKKGEYVIKLGVMNNFDTVTRNLKIIAGNTISLTPPLGWNSWNCWGLSVSDKKVRQSADQMKASGLIDHGWSYINIDDGWEDKHDKDGKILTNYKFPNMWGLCDYIHSLGLKIGIYSSPGPRTCGGYEGSYTFEEKDAQAYASWGIDYLKYDWCSYWNIAPKPTPAQLKYPYKLMERALRKTGRDIHYSLCQYGMGNVWEWGAEVGGNSWRTTGDIEDTWESMSSIGFSQNKCSPFAAPGRWNDPDMLVVGWVGWGPSLHYTRLTPHEQYTHITLWSLLASPLLIGCDLSQLDPFTLNLLTNDEVLAVNQDPLGRQAVQIQSTDTYEIWAKELEDGSLAVGLFNKTEKPLYIPVVMKDLKLEGKKRMRDLWTQSDLGQVRDRFEMRCMPHGARLILLYLVDRVIE